MHGVRVPIDLVAYRLGLRDFLQIWETNFEAITTNMIDTLAMMPSLGRIFRRTDRGRTRSAFGHVLVAARCAIFEWDWAVLLNIRRSQGRIFAERGVPLEEIIEVFFSFKELLVPYLINAFAADAPRLRASLDASDRYVRLSFSIVLEAYMAGGALQMVADLRPMSREFDDQISCPAI